MFTRSSSAEPKMLELRSTNGSGANSALFGAPASATGEKSVIGNDLKISGQGLKIIGRGVLQIDGEIEVAAQNVIVRGKVSGVVCGKTIALQASSHVEGDVHHMSLAIEQGALFEGRSRRAADETALNSVVDGKSGDQPGWKSST